MKLADVYKSRVIPVLVWMSFFSIVLYPHKATGIDNDYEEDLRRRKAKVARIIAEAEETGTVTIDSAIQAKMLVLIKIKSPLPNDEPVKDRVTEKQGTGVRIAPNLVLTNHHVVPYPEELDRAIIVANHRAQTHEEHRSIEKIDLPLDDSGRWAGVFVTNPTLDYTIFEVKADSDVKFPHARGYSDFSLYDQGPLHMLAHPGGWRVTLSPESRRVPMPSSERMQFAGIETFPHSLFHMCNTWNGSSGGALFDARGAFIALHVQGHTQRDGSDVVNLVNEGVKYSSILSDLQGDTNLLESDRLVAESRARTESIKEATKEWSIAFDLIGMPAGHEEITRRAIVKSGVATLEIPHVQRALINGTIDADFPRFRFAALPRPIRFWRAHFGAHVYQHSMLTKDEYDADIEDKEKATILIEEKIKPYLISQASKVLELRRIDEESAAHELGILVHTVQDSFSPAHLIRTDHGIETIFYYLADDHHHGRHRELDRILLDDGNTWKPEALQASNVTAKIYEILYSQEAPQVKLDEFQEVLDETFKLAPNPHAGSLSNDVPDSVALSPTAEMDVDQLQDFRSAGRHLSLASSLEAREEGRYLESFSTQNQIELSSMGLVPELIQESAMSFERRIPLDDLLERLDEVPVDPWQPGDPPPQEP